MNTEGDYWKTPKPHTDAYKNDETVLIVRNACRVCWAFNLIRTHDLLMIPKVAAAAMIFRSYGIELLPTVCRYVNDT